MHRALPLVDARRVPKPAAQAATPLTGLSADTRLFLTTFVAGFLVFYGLIA